MKKPGNTPDKPIGRLTKVAGFLPPPDRITVPEKTVKVTRNMRAPFQVLVIPFRHTEAGPEVALLKRSDSEYWQFVAGGGEAAETPAQAASRELKEETGIDTAGPLIQLDSMATIPKNCFEAAGAWGDRVYVIPEYCFALDAKGAAITLSSEHIEARWVSYSQAQALLKWDSNRNALWELNERLSKGRG